MTYNERKGKKDNFIRENFLNVRPIAFSAISLAAGAAFCYAAFFHGVCFYYILLCLVPFAAYFIFARNKVRAGFCFFLALAFLFIGAGSFALRVENYQNQTLAEGVYEITGDVIDVVESDKICVFTLKNVNANEAEADGNVRCYLYVPNADVRAGMRLRFKAELTRAGKAVRYSEFRAEQVLFNLKYETTAKETPVIVDMKTDVFSLIRRKIKTTLYSALSDDEAALAYALATGNTDGIEEELLSSVRYGGVAHLFAVSGLHIGTIYACLAAFLKKLKSPVIVYKVIPLGAALFFAGVCGFSPSSLRAFLVCCAVAICSLIGLRADGAEGAGFACGGVLLVNPVYLFSLGFQLSAAAYIAIAVLAPALNRVCFPVVKRFPKTKNVFSSLSVMLSVQLCLLPAQLNAFGYASVWGILLNPLLLPLFSVCFPVFVFCTFFACLVPAAANVLLFLPGLALSLFSLFFRKTDFSSVLIYGSVHGAAAMFAYYAFLFVLCRKANFSRAGIKPLACFLVAVFIFSLWSGNYVGADECVVVQSNYYDGFCSALVRTSEANVLIVNEKIPVKRVQSLLYKNGARADAAIVVSEHTAASANSLLSVDCPVIFVPEDEGEGVSFRTREVRAVNSFSFGGVNFTYLDGQMLLMEYDGVKGSFNGMKNGVDFTVFSAEERDGLIFRVKHGILL